MSLTVICFCGYNCNRIEPWRQGDWDAYKWIQALKGKSLNGYAHVPVRGVNKHLSNENLSAAVEWFGIFAADYLAKTKLPKPFVVVPVPNSDCTLSSGIKPRTRRLAKVICDTLNDGSYMIDCLRWKKNLGSAHEGGPREAEILYDNLVLLKEGLDELEDVDEGTSVVLVDDVTTSGGHLQACAAKLKSVDVEVDIVLCGGKTVYDQTNAAFHTYKYTLEEYEP